MDNTEILVAAMSDPEFKTRLAELRKEQEALKGQQTELQENINKNAALVQEARRLNASAASSRDEMAAREQKLANDTADLESANQSLTDEKQRWEKVRQNVDAEHR